MSTQPTTASARTREDDPDQRPEPGRRRTTLLARLLVGTSWLVLVGTVWTLTYLVTFSGYEGTLYDDEPRATALAWLVGLLVALPALLGVRVLRAPRPVAPRVSLGGVLGTLGWAVYISATLLLGVYALLTEDARYALLRGIDSPAFGGVQATTGDLTFLAAVVAAAVILPATWAATARMLRHRGRPRGRRTLGLLLALSAAATTGIVAIMVVGTPRALAGVWMLMGLIIISTALRVPRNRGHVAVVIVAGALAAAAAVPGVPWADEVFFDRESDRFGRADLAQWRAELRQFETTYGDIWVPPRADMLPLVGKPDRSVVFVPVRDSDGRAFTILDGAACEESESAPAPNGDPGEIAWCYDLVDLTPSLAAELTTVSGSTTHYLDLDAAGRVRGHVKVIVEIPADPGDSGDLPTATDPGGSADGEQAVPVVESRVEAIIAMQGPTDLLVTWSEYDAHPTSGPVTRYEFGSPWAAVSAADATILAEAVVARVDLTLDGIGLLRVAPLDTDDDYYWTYDPDTGGPSGYGISTR